MNIDMIQSMYVQQGPVSGKSEKPPSASTESRESTSSSTVSRTTESQLQGVLNSIDGIKQQLNPIIVYDPPFFPIGAPVRMDWILKLNHVQNEAGKEAAKTGGKLRFESQTLQPDATDAQIVGIIQKLGDFSKEAAQIVPAQVEEQKGGAFIDIKV